MLHDRFSRECADRMVLVFINTYHFIQVRLTSCEETDACRVLLNEVETCKSDFKYFADLFHASFPGCPLAYKSALYLVGDETEEMIERMIGKLNGKKISRTE
jgi:hypothetical protein